MNWSINDVSLNFRVRTQKISLFDISYIMYFISLFIDDISSDYDLLVSLIRYTAYIILIIDILSNRKYDIKSLIKLAIFFVASAFISYFTHDFYWCVISAFILSALKSDSESIMKITVILLASGTIIVLTMCAFGFLPNIQTQRGGIGEVRYSLGFYHSDVLPMIIFYIMLFHFMLKKKCGVWEYLLWLIVSRIVFNICDSRNGFYGSVLFLILHIIYTMVSGEKFTRLYKKILFIMAKLSIFVCMIFSIVVTFCQAENIRGMYFINQLFSGRFAIAYHQINRQGGLRLVCFLSRTSYLESAAAIDNGYLYIALRYGLMFWIFYIIVQEKVIKKYKDNDIVYIAIFCISIVNMIDNDLLSYGYLPIIILAFSKYPFCERRVNT